ncbi:hypothetical protein A8924_7015 [Saccharopolyspora erythraea NRRL 2338]|uniref:Uncharacterized protein n=2 Tax=Saccharopolyspora erythraea TaxID=1836 RepID=A4FP54_SACEN|nr:hypothetical protein [Saccharopolyspora erythraea]EQD84793.1 hypothetical protein N599_18350 [Saccharopolyspora erythraea D]PFG99470.1 hypothetical protein A8924_7015 [Saccharopolyspora erythraea NRRL 2338]QRK89376.1 hypothetical protein JQX30_33345 [Saccharopolyspora erythraea]CAM05829.1 hypothetical protein SACE_6663 [Saccharopolyspora erythraea NRRL 2338]
MPPQPPKKKSRAGCIVSIILAVLFTPVLVVGGVIFYYLYGEYSEPVGDPPSNAALPAACDLVSAPTLQRLRTTNPDSTSYEDPETGGYNCNWEQTLGKDGNNPRSLSVGINTKPQPDEDSLDEARMDYEYAKESAASGSTPARVTDVEGFGDQAFVAVTTEDWSGAELVFRKGYTVVTISYHGSDKGLFDSSPIPEAESEAAVKAVAEEVAPRV